MKKNDFAALDNKALQKDTANLKKELLDLRLNVSTMHIKDYSQFKKLRIRIAQALTALNQRKFENLISRKKSEE